MRVDKDKKPSTKICDTHIRLVPFLDTQHRRFLFYCFSACHSGFLRPDYTKKAHCNPTNCEFFTPLELLSEHVIDIDFIKRQQTRELQKVSNFPTIKMYPQEDDNKRLFFWVLDRGNFVYVLRPQKQELVTRLEEDHFRAYVYFKQTSRYALPTS